MCFCLTLLPRRLFRGRLSRELPYRSVECDRQGRIAADERVPTQFDAFALSLERYFETLRRQGNDVLLALHLDLPP